MGKDFGFDQPFQQIPSFIFYNPMNHINNNHSQNPCNHNSDHKNKQTLNEVVVVGYGAKKNKKSTTLGSVVKVEEQAEKEITPQPVIGKRSYQKYLKENLVRPADEKCAQVKGKVVLTFLVNKEGRPFYIKVKESLCESADKEAIRLIQEGPDWIYGNKLAEVTVKFE